METPFLYAGQQAIVFANDAASGDTLGHYCTVVELIPAGVSDSGPVLWTARVLLAASQQYQIVSVDELLPLSDQQPSHLPNYPLQFEVSFDSGETTAVLSGRYRFEQREWQPFRFEHSDELQPSYQLQGPVSASHWTPGELRYWVPRQTTLDRAYVLRSLGELFRVNFGAKDE
jgi:hypothetical protein